MSCKLAGFYPPLFQLEPSVWCRFGWHRWRTVELMVFASERRAGIYAGEREQCRTCGAVKDLAALRADLWRQLEGTVDTGGGDE